MDEAFVAPPESEPPAEPAAAPAPEPEPEVPAWVSQPTQLQPQQPQYAPPQPQYAPPQPQYSPPPQPQYPAVNVDDLVNRPGEVLYGAAERVMSPYVEKVNRLDQFMRQSFESQVTNAATSAKGAIDQGYRNVISRDPAYANKAVRATVDALLQNQFQNAVTIAQQTGDFSQLNNFANPKYMQMVLAGAKIHAGYPGGQAPGPINVQGAYTESSRSAPGSPSGDVPEEVRDAAHRLNMDPKEMWTKVQAAEKKQRDLGWVKK